MTHLDDAELVDRFYRRMSAIEREVPSPPPWPHTAGTAGLPWRRPLRTLWGTTTLVVAGLFVALFGGFLVSGIMVEQHPGGPAPGAVTASPSASPPVDPTTHPTVAPVMTTAEPTPAGSFRSAGRLAEAHLSATATLLRDGRVAVIGGVTQNPAVYPRTEVWDPATGTFDRARALRRDRNNHTATLLADGRVLLIGGRAYGGKNGNHEWTEVVPDAESWDQTTGRSRPAGLLVQGRSSHTATLLADGRVLVVGGFDAVDDALASAEIWDPATREFSPTGSVAQARVEHTSTLLPDGRVLVVGGYDQLDHDGLATAELWDPETEEFNPAGSAAVGRDGHSATLLPDGRVLIVGGYREELDAPEQPEPHFGGRLDPAVTSAEIWDPATSSFTAAGTLAQGRFGHTATLLPDGHVLVVGGWGRDVNEEIASAELWDPADGSFRDAGRMARGRAQHEAIPLPGGRVLIVGDSKYDGGFQRSALIWEPAAGLE